MTNFTIRYDGKPPDLPDGDRWLNITEAATWRGCTEQTLWNDRKKRVGATYYRCGGKIYYKLSDLQRWLEGSRIEGGAKP